MLKRTGVRANALAVTILILLIGVLSPAAQADTTAGKFTVGDFLVLYARSMHLALSPDATPAAVYEALKAVKAVPSEPLNLDAPLTHATVVRIAKAVGLRLTSAKPESEFSRAESQLFLERFNALLVPLGVPHTSTVYAAADNPPGDPASHANTDKGKKKGRPFFCATEPE